MRTISKSLRAKGAFSRKTIITLEPVTSWPGLTGCLAWETLRHLLAFIQRCAFRRRLINMLLRKKRETKFQFAGLSDSTRRQENSKPNHTMDLILISLDSQRH